ncbi:MAG TPA: hypothetical protein VFB38_21945 [Chthonomonadaceae bacterium]|nr:hypothetical protein [Chthonomonadaceae bacterium]
MPAKWFLGLSARNDELADCVGINNGDAFPRKTAEVGSVQCEYVRDAMRQHHGYKPGIKDLAAKNVVSIGKVGHLGNVLVELFAVKDFIR